MLERIRIVMVEPTHPGNIGAAARAMKVMGLSDLRLVRPQDYPCAEATARASGAADVLETARVCESLDQALDGANLVVGTSARQRRIPWPCITARQLGEQVVSEPEQTEVAVLFGREARGLTNDELRRCNLHVTIPAEREYGVLNVAAAIQLICYELRQGILGDEQDLPEARSRREAMPLPQVPWDEPPASSAETEQFLVHLERVMRATGFLHTDHAGQAMTRLRRLFLRARPDKMEISILRGVLVSMEKKLPEGSGDV